MTASTFYDVLATVRYTTLRGTTSHLALVRTAYHFLSGGSPTTEDRILVDTRNETTDE